MQQAQPQQPPEHVDARTLIVGLVDIVAAGSAVSVQFERLAQKLNIPPGPPMIVFLTGMMRVLRDLPDKAYADNNARVAILEAVQTALDAAIDAEEEMNEGEDDMNDSTSERDAP